MTRPGRAIFVVSCLLGAIAATRPQGQQARRVVLTKAGFGATVSQSELLIDPVTQFKLVQFRTRVPSREVLMMTPESYATAFRASAIKRAKLWMSQRNARVALGNAGPPHELPLLEAMQSHESEIVRSHATWARGQISAWAAQIGR